MNFFDAIMDYSYPIELQFDLNLELCPDVMSYEQVLDRALAYHMAVNEIRKTERYAKEEK